MSNDTKDLPPSADTLHTCSYACERPGCIRAQRDYLAARLAAIEADRQRMGGPVAWRWSESNGERWSDWTTDWSHHDRAAEMGCQIEYAAPSPDVQAEANYAHTVPDECETLHWRGQILSMNELVSVSPPAAGEEIMVNTPYDVFILPLRPSGLTSGPRFVVHVPGPEQQPAAPDVKALVEALREEIERLLDELERLFDEIERLLDSRERDGDRLDWLLARLPGDVIRDLVGEMSCTSDVAEWRHRIDKAARFNPRPGEFGG